MKAIDAGFKCQCACIIIARMPFRPTAPPPDPLFLTASACVRLHMLYFAVSEASQPRASLFSNRHLHSHA